MHVKTKLGNIWANFFCSQLNQHLVYVLGDLRNLKFADIAIFEHLKKGMQISTGFCNYWSDFENFLIFRKLNVGIKEVHLKIWHFEISR